MKKKLVSIAIVFGIMLALFPVSAFAAGTESTETMRIDNTVYGTIKLSGVLEEKEGKFDFGSGDVRNWSYTNVAAGSMCSIIPFDVCKYTIIELTAWTLENGEYSPADYENMTWHKLYADGQAEDIAYGDELDRMPLATSKHPASFVFGKNLNVKSPFDDEPCSFELKADGTLYRLDVDFYNESGECVASFVAPFFVKENSPDNDSNKPSSFTDVKPTDYFAKAVDWAVNGHITFGTSKTTFSPNIKCTDGQILTFLWRAMGRPEPTVKSPFNDISEEKDYFYKPALWAYEKGLISGGTFDSEKPCTRSMVVTYLWRLAGSPTAPAASFTDVPGNSEYAPAVSWAVQQGITSGTSKTTFAPDGTCTRGQIVTFLYRAYGK